MRLKTIFSITTPTALERTVSVNAGLYDSHQKKRGSTSDEIANWS